MEETKSGRGIEAMGARRTGLTLRTTALLILSSLLNGALGTGSFFFAAFATHPEMSDVTMRLGYYVMNGIVVVAAVGVVAPWILAYRRYAKGAITIAILPTVLLGLAAMTFLLLDSWLQRTFGS